MSLKAAKRFIEEFNEGNWHEISEYFKDDFSIFYKFLSQYNLETELDDSSIDEDFLNAIIFAKLEKNPKETLNMICEKYITDVYPMKDGYYLLLSSRDELAKLFSSSGRNYSAKDVAERVLGEDSMEAFDRTTYDVYSDVIEELDEKNTRYLADYILKEIGNQDLNVEDYSSEFFEDLANEQSREGFFQITSNDVFDLIKDNEAMNELLKGDLDELRGELYNIHWNAYNNAYESEVYSSVWSELETYFTKDFEHQTKELPSGKKRTYEYVKIRDFYGDIYNFLSTHKMPEWRSYMIDYVDNYVDFLYQRMYDWELDFLDFRTPDYPDYTLVRQYVNEFFGDYI
jgi:hypothetical protein